jgi:SSS family solute:Na+ symporter
VSAVNLNADARKLFTRETSRDIASAQRTPLIAAVPKALFPFVVIVPGVVAAALAIKLPLNDAGEMKYDYTLTMMLKHFYPSGLLGVGVAALLASFLFFIDW